MKSIAKTAKVRQNETYVKYKIIKLYLQYIATLAFFITIFHSSCTDFLMILLKIKIHMHAAYITLSNL